MTPVKKSALGQRPANMYEKKLVGIVEVTVGEKKAKFELVAEDGKAQKTFANGKTTLVVPLEDLPAFPKLTSAHTGKQFRIRMNNEGDEVEALTPVTGHYAAKLIELGPTKKGEEPTPYEKQDNFPGKEESSHLEFFAVYKIISGAFKGVQMPGYYLHYKFEKDEDGTTRFAGNFDNKKATRLFQLFDWGKAHGLWDEPIEWEDVTILPVLQERALENDVTVDIIVKDGYIREILPAQDEEPFEAPKKKHSVNDEMLEELEQDSKWDGSNDTVNSPKKRSVKELKAELSGDPVNGDDELDKIAPPPAKTAKKAAKKVVEEDEEDL